MNIHSLQYFIHIQKADSNRSYLVKSLGTKGKDVPHATIVSAVSRYIPSIHQLLLTCRVQPENAQLDSRLIFEWSSGIEAKSRFFKSEALMYELVMSIATEAVATAGVGSDQCTRHVVYGLLLQSEDINRTRLYKYYL